MNKQFLRFYFAFMILLSMQAFIACNKEDATTDAVSATEEGLVDETLYALEQRGNLGKHGCYDLVFPVTIQFTDGSTKTVESQDSLKSAVRAWHKANGGNRHERPSFVFPIQVIAEDGSVITVADESALNELRKACRKTGLDSLHRRDSLHHKGFPHHDTTCFTIVFPIQVKKADGTIITVNSKEELKVNAGDQHKKGHGKGFSGKLNKQLDIVFPITVKKSDGTSVTVGTKEDLKKLREGC